jgi:hypothetical protein
MRGRMISSMPEDENARSLPFTYFLEKHAADALENLTARAS